MEPFQQIEMQSFSAHKFEPLSSLSKRQSANSIVNTSKDLQKTLKRRYQVPRWTDRGGDLQHLIHCESKADRGTYRF